MTKHEFLAALHALLQPRGYLEIGVQTGGSLNLASCPAIGIDPNPLLGPHGQQQIFPVTSDEFFYSDNQARRVLADFPPIDLVFIDGMHLFEYALRDYLNVERYANPNTVIVFDDVLPYNEAIADRDQPPGDWTGDVWKVVEILSDLRFDLEHRLVDVWSTGAFVVWNAGISEEDHRLMEARYKQIVTRWQDKPMPPWVLSKEFAATPESVLDELRNR